MIAVVEDDREIREIESYALSSAGFEVKSFSSGDEFLSFSDLPTVDLAILDVMLPGTDGVSVLKRIRENAGTRKIPVIMATAKSSEYDKVESLDLGADDYLVKPFGMLEMVSRVRAVLRRSSTSSPEGDEISYAGITVNDRNHKVEVLGEEVTLTLKEYDLLSFLMRNVGAVFSRDALLDKVWNNPYGGETRTVDAHVKTLRQKLLSLGDLIETVRGVGYRMKDVGEK